MSRQLTGAAGEFFVAAELSRRGWAANVTPRGVERTDVLAQHPETGDVVALQVKTTTTTGTSFTLGEKDETPTHTINEWYALVGLGAADSLPDYYLLPRNHVAVLLYVHHFVWRRESAKDGTPHRDTLRRNISAKNITHAKDAWAQLERPTPEIPLVLSPFYQAIFDKPSGVNAQREIAERARGLAIDLPLLPAGPF